MSTIIYALGGTLSGFVGGMGLLAVIGGFLAPIRIFGTATDQKRIDMRANAIIAGIGLVLVALILAWLTAVLAKAAG